MVANNSRKNFLAFYKNMKEMRKEIKEGLARNIKDACEVMIEAAQENTPPCKGERRGTDTWTGELRRHWDYKISNTGLNTTVLLYNDMQYASYVENGHRMDKHFVPWLYIDDTGVISRHNPVAGEGLFGLVVGTKTKYVPPAHMVEKAVNAFQDALDVMNNDLMRDISRKYGK